MASVLPQKIRNLIRIISILLFSRQETRRCSEKRIAAALCDAKISSVFMNAALKIPTVFPLLFGGLAVGIFSF